MGFESGGHGVRGFSDGDDEDTAVRVKIVEIVADAQDAARAVHIAGEGAFDGGVLQCGSEYLAGDFAHVAELLVALRSQVGHGRDYRGSCWSLKVMSQMRLAAAAGGMWILRR